MSKVFIMICRIMRILCNDNQAFSVNIAMVKARIAMAIDIPNTI